MHSGRRWELGRRPALDGLRGLAILFVLGAHFNDPATNPTDGGGMVGVTAFFTLSGFLITSLLIEEHARTGGLSLRSFYVRRARRLLPALVVVLVAVEAAGMVGRTLGVDRDRALATLFYVSNFWQAGHDQITGLSHTWSLAIEEQFYLVWPLVFLLGIRWGRRGVGIGAALGIVVSLVVLWAPGGESYYGSIERSSNLLAGCLLAVVMSGARERASRPFVAAAALAAMVPLVFLRESVPVEIYVTAVPVGTVVMLWASAQGAGVRWLSGPVLRWFGSRSYGIYLIHYPVLAAFPLAAGVPWWHRSLVLLALSLVLAELSWRLIESRFLRRSESAHAALAPKVLVPNHALRARAEG